MQSFLQEEKDAINTKSSLIAFVHTLTVSVREVDVWKESYKEKQTKNKHRYCMIKLEKAEN